MKEISVKGILLGVVTLLLLDSLGDIMLVALMGGELSSEVSRQLWTTTSFLLFRTAVALIALLAAGYVTAKMTKSSFYLNASLVGILSQLLTILAISNSDWPLWFSVTAFLTQIPFVLLGTHLVARKIEQENLVLAN